MSMKGLKGEGLVREMEILNLGSNAHEYERSKG